MELFRLSVCVGQHHPQPRASAFSRELLGTVVKPRPPLAINPDLLKEVLSYDGALKYIKNPVRGEPPHSLPIPWVYAQAARLYRQLSSRSCV